MARASVSGSTEAIVDRLTFSATLIETGTESYRLARTKANKANGTK